MIIPYQVIVWILEGLGAIAGLLIIVIFLNKLLLRYRIWESRQIKKYLVAKYLQKQSIQKHFSKRKLTDEFINICEQTELDDDTLATVVADFDRQQIIAYHLFRLNSLKPTVRKASAHYLAFFRSRKALDGLKKRLVIEKNDSVKLYLLNSLKTNLDESVDIIIESLVGASAFYRRRAIEIITHHHNRFSYAIQAALNRSEFEIKELVAAFAAGYKNDDLKAYLQKELISLEAFYDGNQSNQLRYDPLKFNVDAYYFSILRTLVDVYDENIFVDRYLTHSKSEVRRIVIDAKSKRENFDGIKSILEGCDGSDMDFYRVEVITRIAEINRDYYLNLVSIFQNPGHVHQQKVIASVLSFRTEYLILKLSSPQRTQIIESLKLLVSFGLTADLIDFMNQNKDLGIENDLFQILKIYYSADERLKKELHVYLRPEILKRMGIEKETYAAPVRERSKVEKKKVQWLRRLLFVALVFFPIVFLIRYNLGLLSKSLLEILIAYAVDINYYIVFYYVAVNLIYLLLVLLSMTGSREQSRLWSFKNKNMLFESEMLSSISIIAPAYNEELSIIDSVNSLLNLNYPQYEVIVVNDGSKDKTLQKLIEYFKLERKNLIVSQKLPTMHVRGVYRNKLTPYLTVIDKDNGGKADALNTGINYAVSEYICGIDADSMLEVNSLLKLMSVTIDHKYSTICLGGNIFPANGCEIDRGQVEKKGLPKTLITRLQAIEYLRAFTSGRIGWAKLRSLLIVSGAFGLFHRNTMIEAGGYLTSSGIFKKDTVGEDMELVVRLSRKALEEKKPYQIDYVYNAHCYTEVPNDWKSLFKQRDRWHRGLIDILSFHRHLIFNPRYKTVGTVGLPYFLIFEMIGPLFEAQGYLMLILSIVFGLLDLNILLALFSVSVMMGIIVSLLSLLATERESKYLGFSDTLTLVIFGIIENLGYRQLMSLYRVKGYFSAMRETGLWGTVTRRGFKKTK